MLSLLATVSSATSSDPIVIPLPNAQYPIAEGVSYDSWIQNSQRAQSKIAEYNTLLTRSGINSELAPITSLDLQYAVPVQSAISLEADIAEVEAEFADNLVSAKGEADAYLESLVNQYSEEMADYEVDAERFNEFLAEAKLEAKGYYQQLKAEYSDLLQDQYADLESQYDFLEIDEAAEAVPYDTIYSSPHEPSSAHEPQAADDPRCDYRKPVSSTDSDTYEIELSSYRNCIFMYTWIDYMEEADLDSEEVMDTEYKFAFGMWMSRFGEWYQSCLPDDHYATMWPGVNNDAPSGEDGGLARCTTRMFDGIEKVTGCECYPLSNEYKSSLSAFDVNLVMDGNCATTDGSECAKGAKSIAKSKGWGEEMQWMAILESLDEILDFFTEGIHLNVQDVYYLNANYPQMLADDCTSCQYYAAMRPMPYIKGVNPQFIYEDMVELGRRQPVEELES